MFIPTLFQNSDDTTRPAGELVPLEILGMHQRGFYWFLQPCCAPDHAHAENAEVAWFTLLYRQNFLRV